MRIHFLPLIIVCWLLGALHTTVSAQDGEIVLPEALTKNYPQYSGLCLHGGRLYLLPQYGITARSLRGEFILYAVRTDSLDRAILDKTQTPSYRPIRVKGMRKIKRNISDEYQGFEAISLVGTKVFLVMETRGGSVDNYLFSGSLDTTRWEITMRPEEVVLPRPKIINQAGFESIVFLAEQKKLLLTYEYNGDSSKKMAYLVDTNMQAPVIPVKLPVAYFRITDLFAEQQQIFALQYCWGGNLRDYICKNSIDLDEVGLDIPELQSWLNSNAECRKNEEIGVARILVLDSLSDPKWRVLKVVESHYSRNNWEGIVRYRKGFFIISDSNDSDDGLKTTLKYINW